MVNLDKYKTILWHLKKVYENGFRRHWIHIYYSILSAYLFFLQIACTTLKLTIKQPPSQNDILKAQTFLHCTNRFLNNKKKFPVRTKS